jgi:hypothetical protein
MKFLKLGLRLWITIASLFSFIVGWIMLGHSPKPVQASSSSNSVVAPLPTLAPLPPLNSDNGINVQNQQLFFDNQSQPQPSFRPRPFFSTGGS